MLLKLKPFCVPSYLERKHICFQCVHTWFNPMKHCYNDNSVHSALYVTSPTINVTGFRGRGGRGGGQQQQVTGFRGRGVGGQVRGRGRGRGGRGRGRGRGAAAPVQLNKEDLDNQLDAYMSKTKSGLDAELDAYMAEADME